jgi:hypothetical protein
MAQNNQMLKDVSELRQQKTDKYAENLVQLETQGSQMLTDLQNNNA